ncbi:MAG: retron St85 family RNA-directed DNA polymerase [Oscillatoria sp. Prado101]|jgi:retron-type reverse transcriptase|nr:retron St85 family RNA-directed DNA polymerase [Oscillatoria sp. Prado101]
MDSGGILGRGISQYKQGKYQEAIEDLNEVIRHNPNCVRALQYRCLTHIRQENKLLALEDLQKVAQLMGDREYADICQKLQEFIESFCRNKKTEHNSDEESSELQDGIESSLWEEGRCISEDYIINGDGRWDPIEWDMGWVDIDDEEISLLIADAEDIYYRSKNGQFKMLERWLERRLDRVEALQKKRSENANFEKERLQSNGLPLCNSHEAIAQAMKISVRRLRFLAFYRKKPHYKRFQIPKKMGGKREISAPMPLLKQAQNWILHNILEKLELHSAAHGFRRERSIVTNAQPHVGAEVILNIDLKDFFPSISYKRVKGLFKSCGYSETASIIFALICTEPRVKEFQLDGQTNSVLSWTERHLPQGAPTSPAISNLLCRRLDRRLTEMAEQLGFVYTRYADDLTFSASGDSLRNICKVFKVTRSIIKYEGFDINEDKTRVFRKSRQQEVTGVVVNSKLNVSRETLKRFRATLYQIEKDGLRGKHWGQSKTNDLIASLQGFANFVYMINPEKGAKFQEQVRRIKEKYGRRKAKVEPVSEPMNQSHVVALISTELKQLGWDKKQRRGYMRDAYGKQSLQQLTDEQLLELLEYLTNLRQARSRDSAHRRIAEIARMPESDDTLLGF